MKKLNLKCILCMGLATVLCIGFCSGCGREKEIDYQVDGVSGQSITERGNVAIAGGKNSLSQFAGETVWTDAWTVEEIENATIEIEVDAQVILPDVEEMYVVEVTVPEFDEAFKEHVSETLFGENTVYYNDVAHLPKKELNEIYMEYRALYDAVTSEPDREYYGEQLQVYEKLMAAAGDTYIPAEAYTANNYIGEKDGVTYELYFSGAYGREDWALSNQYFNFYPLETEKVRPEGYEECVFYMAHPYMTVERYINVGENECKFSLEEAESMARELFDELGLEYPVLDYAKPLMWGDETMSSENIYHGDWHANGYVLSFSYGVEGISFAGFGTGGQYQIGFATDTFEFGEQQPYIASAFADVYVSDKGIISVFVDGPVETTKISDSVELLPLDTIKEIMQENKVKPFDAMISYSDYTYTEIYTHMELIYFRVRDRENPLKYSYIPAWRLSEQMGDPVMNNRGIRNALIINAIDGTWIDIFDEL